MEKSNLLKDNKKLMEEYNFERNINLDLEKLSSGSGRKAWWKCSKGHEWEATINSRNQGRGCPYCIGKKTWPGYNDLATTNPKLAKEWNYEKNGELKPQDVTMQSNLKVWWKCSKGHEWEDTISVRNRGYNCPYCSNYRIEVGYNDLATKYPRIASEWNYEKNGTLTPQDVISESNKKVWWKCSKGHEYISSVINRTKRNDGCPYCSNHKLLKGYNDLATMQPKLAKEWNYEKNGTLIPENVINGARKKVWWKCSKGHEWICSIDSRTKKNGSNCPICDSEKHISLPEKIVYFYINKYAGKTLQNYSAFETSRRDIDIYNDFYKIGIEYDGCYFHKSTKKDLEKDNLCEQQGIKLYRIREIGCKDYNSSSIKMYVKSNDYVDLSNAIKRILNDLNIKCSNIDIDEDMPKIYELIEFNEKEASLLNENPELAKEWNYEKNGTLKPDKVYAKSGKKVWWKCSKGHEWQAKILNRSNGKGCPYCAGQKVLIGYNDLATTNPKLADEWNYKKNINLTPHDVVEGSTRKVWWICPKGHEYEAMILVRNRGNGCPICSNHKLLKGYNDLATTNPKLASEWNYEKNKNLTPQDIFAGSGKAVWWKCSKGHEWQATPNNRSQGRGCPKCNSKGGKNANNS